MDNENIVLKAEHLTKYYGAFPALRNLEIEIERGQIVGLLGPNGSGKTTFIKIAAGLLTPSAGAVSVSGENIGTKTKAKVSYLPERPYFPSWMTAAECIGVFKDFYEDFDSMLAARMLSDLEVPLDKKMKELSKGMKEKVQLVLVMARRADLYLLDEPIAGVDPVARDYILDTIIKAYDRKSTVIISTHLITDIQSAIDRFVFIKNGRIAAEGTVTGLFEARGITLNEYFKEVFKC